MGHVEIFLESPGKPVGYSLKKCKQIDIIRTSILAEVSILVGIFFVESPGKIYNISLQ